MCQCSYVYLCGIIKGRSLEYSLTYFFMDNVLLLLGFVPIINADARTSYPLGCLLPTKYKFGNVSKTSESTFHGLDKDKTGKEAVLYFKGMSVMPGEMMPL